MEDADQASSDIDDVLVGSDPIPIAALQIESPKWESTLNRIIPAIVSIRSISVRNFDTESQRTSQASGFVVDHERGIIMTNRHVVQPGPILAEAIFTQTKEEVKLTPIYRDPGICLIILSS